MSFNPYQPPTAGSDEPFTSSQPGQGSVSGRTLQALRKTKPWIVLFVVLGFIGTGFCGLGALGVISMAARSGLPMWLGFIYIVIGAIYLMPTLALFKYSKAIDRLGYGGGVEQLDEAIEAQAKFWQVAGILTVVGIVLAILASFTAASAFAELTNAL